jgi:hypothetical protein
MLCEFRREMHAVEDQIGCDLVQVDNQAVKSLLPYEQVHETCNLCSLKLVHISSMAWGRWYLI